MDCETVQQIIAYLKPVPATEDDIAVDAIREVGSTGHFFGCQHTQDRYETAFLRPLPLRLEQLRELGGARLDRHRAARQRRLEEGSCRVRGATDGRGDPRGARRVRGAPQARGWGADGFSESRPQYRVTGTAPGSAGVPPAPGRRPGKWWCRKRDSALRPPRGKSSNRSRRAPWGARASRPHTGRRPGEFSPARSPRSCGPASGSQSNPNLREGSRKRRRPARYPTMEATCPSPRQLRTRRGTAAATCLISTSPTPCSSSPSAWPTPSLPTSWQVGEPS